MQSIPEMELNVRYRVVQSNPDLPNKAEQSCAEHIPNHMKNSLGSNSDNLHMYDRTRPLQIGLPVVSSAELLEA